LFGRPSDLGRSRAAVELRLDGGAESVGAECVLTLRVQANVIAVGRGFRDELLIGRAPFFAACSQGKMDRKRGRGNHLFQTHGS
jgi:hypothetical protein